MLEDSDKAVVKFADLDGQAGRGDHQVSTVVVTRPGL